MSQLTELILAVVICILGIVLGIAFIKVPDHGGSMKKNRYTKHEQPQREK